MQARVKAVAPERVRKGEGGEGVESLDAGTSIKRLHPARTAVGWEGAMDD